MSFKEMIFDFRNLFVLFIYDGWECVVLCGKFLNLKLEFLFLVEGVLLGCDFEEFILELLLLLLQWMHFGLEFFIFHLNVDYFREHLSVFFLLLAKGNVELRIVIFEFFFFFLVFNNDLLIFDRVLLGIRVLFTPYFAKFFLFEVLFLLFRESLFKLG